MNRLIETEAGQHKRPSNHSNAGYKCCSGKRPSLSWEAEEEGAEQEGSGVGKLSLRDYTASVETS